MSDFDQVLREELLNIQRQGLFRECLPVESPQAPEIQIRGKRYLNFASNDYLGLANHPALKAAAIEGVRTYGAGAGASRLICGSLDPHRELERLLAQFKGTPSALTFSTGYATSLGVICALMSKQDFIVMDRLVHASIVDASRMSGATLRVFAHNSMEDLEKKLVWASEARERTRTEKSTSKPRVLIVTESVFSMDGDLAPLREMVRLKEKYGAWLMVDEAHGTGVFGQSRCGVAELEGVASQIEVQMGTLGKALGASGGYICGSKDLVEFLVNRARSFIFSTAPVPAAAAAARAGVELVRGTEGSERQKQLCERIYQFYSHFCEAGQTAAQLQGLSSGEKVPERERRSAIVPIIVGAEQEAVLLAVRLREMGYFIPAIRYPSVARGAARLRLAFTVGHQLDDIEKLAETLLDLGVNWRNERLELEASRPMARKSSPLKQ